ncbi:hypothetical protein M5D96_013634, partial [Drosophila gunungcola]
SFRCPPPTEKVVFAEQRCALGKDTSAPEIYINPWRPRCANYRYLLTLFFWLFQNTLVRQGGGSDRRKEKRIGVRRGFDLPALRNCSQQLTSFRDGHVAMSFFGQQAMANGQWPIANCRYFYVSAGPQPK